LATHQGIALIGPRSNSKTAEFAIPLPLPPNLPGLNATVARVESLPPDVPVPLAAGGNFLHWREKLETSAEVVEASTDGWPALIRSAGLHYLAGWPDEAAFTRLLTNLCQQAGIETDPLPEGLRRRDSATHRFLFNYNAVPVEWGGEIIPPAGVSWQPYQA
jgi:beta-galactosidase